mmetsp:Transcript_17914/g.52354  ORF Transcript_17914/g.52354 Transcript_17914/m.52354 type:complete len:486 (-) Transcript_17914:110-1567(-)
MRVLALLLVVTSMSSIDSQTWRAGSHSLARDALFVFGGETPAFPDAARGLERALEEYQEGLSVAAQRLADEHVFLLERVRVDASPAVARARAMVAERVARRLGQLPACWDTNVEALRDLLRPLALISALLPEASTTSGLGEIHEEGGAGAADGAACGYGDTPGPVGVEACVGHGDAGPRMVVPGSLAPNGTGSSSSYDSAIQVLVHAARDWSVEGARVRGGLMDPILAAVAASSDFSGEQSGSPTILVPGAGTGRLAFELARMGFRVEANEVSLPMVAALSRLVVAACGEASSENARGATTWRLHPFLHEEDVNQLKSSQRFQMVQVPDISLPREEGLQVLSRLSVQHAEFVRFYGEVPPGMFDSVVTCFFLDTAADVLDYISTIHRVLRPGGRWINYGPLQWHRTSPGLMLAVDQLLDLLPSLGFRLEPEFTRLSSTFYSPLRTEETSTRPDFYQPILFVALRVEAEEGRDGPTPNIGPHIPHH